MQTPSLLRRLASLLYDTLVVAALLILASAIVTTLSGQISDSAPKAALQLLALALVTAYFIWCWVRGGQTLAMKTWRIQVIEPGHAGIRVATALKRYLIAAGGLALAGIGFWWALFDREGQFLHDRVIGTRLVMRVQSGTQHEAPAP